MYTNSFGTSYKCNIYSPHKTLLSICISNQPFFYYKYIVLNKIFLKKKALPQVASSLQPYRENIMKKMKKENNRNINHLEVHHYKSLLEIALLVGSI